MKERLCKKALEIASNAIYKTAVKEADSACLLFSYQPKVPKKLKKR